MSKTEQKVRTKVVEEHAENANEEKNTRADLIRLCLMAVASAIALIDIGKSFSSIDVVAIVAIFAGGYPVYKETFESLRHLRINMEVSMTIAIFASLAIGQYAVSTLITFFVLLSEYIEGYAVDKGRATVDLLEKSVPKRALVRRNGTEIEVEVQTLVDGDVVIVRQGDRIPVDGTIVFGSAFVNQSMITGESTRVEKNADDTVYAGSVNESGLIEVKTERVGNETLFGKIIKLVEEAESKRAPIQRISDKLATYLVEFAIGLSMVTYLLTRNLTSTISVIVVAGACGVAAGTPLAIVAIMSNAAKRGAVIKGGAYVEEMDKIDTVVIDKTGTLTLGQPAVDEIVCFAGHTEREILEFASIAERHSNHPLARAILKRTGRESMAGLPALSDSDVSTNYFAGKGVVLVEERTGKEILVGNMGLMKEKSVRFPSGDYAKGESISGEKTRVYVAVDGEAKGIITFADGVRAESEKAISDLRKLGIRTIMLTGDNHDIAEAVAKEVGIDEFHSELLPQDKVSFVERLVSRGHRVAMVGDGINDAPALARANVGIGMGGGTDVAIEEADIVLMTNDLQKISDIAKMSRKAYRTIMTNFYGTVSVDGIGISLAALGMLNPILAAVIHVVSELVFILNSARLMK
jgi:heavy metal translocating P-type ATPase